MLVRIGERGTLVHCSDRNLNYYSQYGKQYEVSPKIKKKKIEPPYNPAAPLLGKNPEERKVLSKRYVNFNVHCSILYNSQDRKTV